MPSWRRELTDERSFDPIYRPSMATYDYRSSGKRPVEQKILSKENEALCMAARTVDSPFTDEILNVLNPRKFSMPIFTLFDGTSDPIEHVYHIQVKMALNTENDTLMCKVFPTSFTGPARNWFKNLLEGERLQTFLTKFNLEKSMVIECHPSTAVQAFKLAMNRGTLFHTNLEVNAPKTMDELNQRADSFVRLEEEEAANARKTSMVVVGEKTRTKISQKQVAPHCPTPWKAEKRPREEESITPLKYFGHLTNECKNLRRQVEMLIAKEEFAGYIQRPAIE
ncbi:uncharacterized protein LOC132270173 [Cornus florida]|uniref:uncharacterized protein LOC132270173 n=1 Tax=Cornus florida TaxID=4283 RepID=UPI0028A0F8A0|nr:uncharacterized protein LOC132270173 [Cornus florida]